MAKRVRILKSTKYFSVLARVPARGGPADEVAEAYPRITNAAPVGMRRIGIAKGEFEVPADIDGDADRIRELFGCR